MCNLADGYLKYSPENNGRCRCSQLTGCIGNQPTFAQLSPKSVVCCSVSRVIGQQCKKKLFQHLYCNAPIETSRDGIWQVIIIKETLWLEHTLRMIKFYLGCLIGCFLDSKTVLTIVLGRSFFYQKRCQTSPFSLRTLKYCLSASSVFAF